MKRELKEMPAGVSDEYTEKIKAMRNKEQSQGIRQVKHVRDVMVEFIESMQEDLKKS